MQLKLLQFPQYMQVGTVSKLDTINNTAFGLISSDLRNLWSFVNSFSKTLDVLEELPSPERFGFNGTNLLVFSQEGNSGLSIGTSGKLYNKNKRRPKTIYEALNDLYSVVDSTLLTNNIPFQIEQIKTAIGARVFDPLQLSSSSSLDSKIDNIEKNIIQLAADIFNEDQSTGDTLGTTYYLNDNAEQSVNVSVTDKINELLAIHGGTLGGLNHNFADHVQVWACGLGEFTVDQGSSYAAVPFSGYAKELSGPNLVGPKHFNTTGLTFTLYRLSLYIGENFTDAQINVKLYKNESNTGVIIQIPPGQVGYFNTSDNNVVDFNDTDSISFIIECTGTADPQKYAILNSITINAKYSGD